MIEEDAVLPAHNHIGAFMNDPAVVQVWDGPGRFRLCAPGQQASAGFHRLLAVHIQINAVAFRINEYINPNRILSIRGGDFDAALSQYQLLHKLAAIYKWIRIERKNHLP